MHSAAFKALDDGHVTHQLKRSLLKPSWRSQLLFWVPAVVVGAPAPVMSMMANSAPSHTTGLAIVWSAVGLCCGGLALSLASALEGRYRHDE